jgi:phosphoribosyl 1,2-cyclic phosphate phosphodiesterase
MGLTATILGCGSSGGVPRLGGHWGDCDPGNPKNRRRRCSMLLQRTGPGGTTRVLIDTSPDLRDQLLDAGIGELDAVVYTHSHADHVHGIDDLRQIVFNTHRRLAVWADPPTQASLLARFGYAFVQPSDTPYPPILDMHTIHGPFTIEGGGGPIELVPFRVDHGSMEALGFRVEGLAYLPDVVATHAHLALSLDWIARAAPRRAVLTNMHIDLDHATLEAELPPHIRPAHDGMVLDLTSDSPSE